MDIKTHPLSNDKRLPFVQPESVTVTASCLLQTTLSYALAGTAIFFVLYFFLARNEDCFGTFIAAFSSGAIGVFFCSFWFRRYHWGKIAQTAIVAAYIARVLVGVDSYLSTDPHYFQGNGNYLSNNWEFYWTYENATKAADNLLRHGEWRPSQTYEIGDTKNANIHSWMGYFLAAGKSHNALDLAPFNSFHHVVAGIIIVGLAITLGYPLGASFLAGVATAWIPWAFPASLMWRDSVGICWIVAAIALVVIGRNFGLVGRITLAFPAALLASSVREPYLLVVLVSTIYLYVNDTKKNLSVSNNVKLAIFLLIIVTGIVLIFPSLVEYVFGRHQTLQNGFWARFATIPLLIVRGIAGPFPWINPSGSFEMDYFPDYIFHVCQLAVLLVLMRNWRSILLNSDVLILNSIMLWFIGVLAVGVHTAYLAVAMPFILPVTFKANDHLWTKFIISLFLFIGGNALYLLTGLQGSGLLIKTTGY
ncbi:hypothetical protein [Geomonas edaphica]|uniref:hypothetical protein n=1 Tax=Geomonas edaphica TaxID=2570226 RepID=UPI0010A82CB4|nr:hypothetical protein [Geomonas edaphica]